MPVFSCVCIHVCSSTPTTTTMTTTRHHTPPHRLSRQCALSQMPIVVPWVEMARVVCPLKRRLHVLLRKMMNFEWRRCGEDEEC